MARDNIPDGSAFDAARQHRQRDDIADRARDAAVGTDPVPERESDPLPERESDPAADRGRG